MDLARAELGPAKGHAPGNGLAAVEDGIGADKENVVIGGRVAGDACPV